MHRAGRFVELGQGKHSVEPGSGGGYSGPGRVYAPVPWQSVHLLQLPHNGQRGAARTTNTSFPCAVWTLQSKNEHEDFDGLHTADIEPSEACELSNAVLSIIRLVICAESPMSSTLTRYFMPWTALKEARTLLEPSLLLRMRVLTTGGSAAQPGAQSGSAVVQPRLTVQSCPGEGGGSMARTVHASARALTICRAAGEACRSGPLERVFWTIVAGRALSVRHARGCSSALDRGGGEQLRGDVAAACDGSAVNP